MASWSASPTASPSLSETGKGKAVTRPEIKPGEVARLWLEEELSIEQIARRYDAGMTTIQRRLNAAREQMGEGAWKECKRERSERRRIRRVERSREADRTRLQNMEEEKP